MILESYPFTIFIVIRINWSITERSVLGSKSKLGWVKGAKAGYISGLLHLLFYAQL